MKVCYHTLYFDSEILIDPYEYHDAPSSLYLHCDRERGHKGLHSLLVKRTQWKGKDIHMRIYWEGDE